MSKVYYDNSMISSFKECPRKFYLRHVRGWTGNGISMPLAFGLSWHNAMDIVWSQYGKMPDREVVRLATQAFIDTWIEQGLPHPDDLTIDLLDKYGARTPFVAAEMLASYLEKRKATFDDPSFKLEAVEQPFAVPIYPDRTDIWYIGRLDKVFSLHGSRIIGEHKTTSEYKIDGGFKSSWVDSWSPSAQIEGYLYAGNIYFDGGVRYVWVDGALVHKKVHDAFKFVPVSASMSSLDGWLWEVRAWIDRINIEKDKLEYGAADDDYMQCFPRNTDSCVGKYGPCSYRDICTSCDNPHKVSEPPDGYVVKFWSPFDLLGIEKLGTQFTPPLEGAE